MSPAARARKTSRTYHSPRSATICTPRIVARRLETCRSRPNRPVALQQRGRPPRLWYDSLRKRQTIQPGGAAGLHPEQLRPRPSVMARKGIFFPAQGRGAARRRARARRARRRGAEGPVRPGTVRCRRGRSPRRDRAAPGRARGRRSSSSCARRAARRAEAQRADPRVLDVVPGGKPGGEGAPGAPPPPVHERQQHAAAGRAARSASRGCRPAA